MSISVVIPVYNNLESVIRCVNTLVPSAGAPFELLLQDDCSPDVNYAGLFPPAVIERNPVNLGFAGNVNQGAKRAHGDILCVVNQDIVAVPGWSDNWVTHLQQAFADPTIGIVIPRLLFENYAVQSCGGIFDARCQPVHRNLGWSNPHHEDVSTACDVSWGTGAFLCIRRELFERIGGFDTAYVGGYFEDTELCGRVAELGYRIRYEPAMSFVHKVGSTGGNPRFGENARLFHERWVKTGKVQPDVNAVLARYW